MDFKSFDEVLKLQQEFADRLGAELEALRKGRPGGSKVHVAGLQMSLNASQSAVEALQQRKQEAVGRLDADIARHQQLVKALQQELEDIDKHARGMDKTVGQTPVRKSRGRKVP